MIDRKSKSYEIVCPSCFSKRLVTYSHYWAISKNIFTKRCRRCAQKEKSGYKWKKGCIPWNKGLHISGMSGKKHTIKQHEALLKHNKINNPSHDPSVREKMRLAKLGRPNYCIRGSKHPLWKGTTPLKKLIIGSLKYSEWRQSIFTRDNYTCKSCNIRGKNLNVHHIISFATLLNKFVAKYNQFSPFEDKEILCRIAESYEPFWNIDNGMTLCNDCHYETPNFGFKGVINNE